MVRGKRPIISALMPLFTAGCVASFTPYIENPAGEVASSTAHCQYTFDPNDVSAWFRGDSVISYNWGTAKSFGYYNIQSRLSELPGSCPEDMGTTKTSATLQA